MDNGNIQPTKVELWRNRKNEQTKYNKETESVIKGLPTNKNPRTDYFSGEIYQSF